MRIFWPFRQALQLLLCSCDLSIKRHQGASLAALAHKNVHSMLLPNIDSVGNLINFWVLQAIGKYPQNIWPYKVQYLHFWILKFPIDFRFFKLSEITMKTIHSRSSFCASPACRPGSSGSAQQPWPQRREKCPVSSGKRLIVRKDVGRFNEHSMVIYMIRSWCLMFNDA